jgi:hypothetical protein
MGIPQDLPTTIRTDKSALSQSLISLRLTGLE